MFYLIKDKDETTLFHNGIKTEEKFFSFEKNDIPKIEGTISILQPTVIKGPVEDPGSEWVDYIESLQPDVFF